MVTARIPKCKCPSCGTDNDATTATPGTNSGPKPGDITICWDCGHIAAFADDLTIRDLTDAKAKEIAGHPNLLRVQKTRAEFRKRRVN